MHDDTSNDAGKASRASSQGLVEIGGLEELVRQGAREILQRAIEAEVQDLLAQYDGVTI